MSCRRGSHRATKAEYRRKHLFDKPEEELLACATEAARAAVPRHTGALASSLYVTYSPPILIGESGIPNLSSRKRTILELVKTGANIPHGTLNNSASILSVDKLLAFVKYGGPKEGVTYTITEAGDLALSSGKYAS